MMDVVLICLLAGLGPGVLALGIWRLYIETRPRTWEKMNGVITQSSIRRSYIGRGIYESLPEFEVEFSYDDIVRRASVEVYSVGSPRSAASVLSRYPLGASVTVFVNPRMRSQVALEARVTPCSWILLVIGGVISVLEIAFLVLQPR